MKKILYLFMMMLALAGQASAQKRTISGTITSKDDGEPVIGASVVEKGTSNGTITDLDGNYSITVSDKATLVVSYVGMKTQELKPAGSHLNVVLASDAIAVEEVVVTAMGIKQEKKRMNFAVQSVDATALTESKSANFVNSLQGKVAGVSVTNGSGSPNAGSQIIIRGISSVNTAQSNEPLFVMDGMPLNGGASAAADINPNDIENITVLKGAAAAALYGQDAANGVVMITTKQGQAGKLTVSANASWQWDQATRLPELQSMYGPGSQGFYKEKTMGGWGPLLNEGEQIYDNIGNFLRTGFYHKYDVSMTGGTEKFQAYASATWSKNQGIVPEDYLQKTGVLVKGTWKPFRNVTVNVSANITNNTSRNDWSSTGMSTIYNWARTYDITNYELTNGYPYFNYYSDTEKFSSSVSPLYARHNDYSRTEQLRNILNGSITYEPVKNLSLTGRLSYDTRSSNTDTYRVPRWDDSSVYQSVKKPEEPSEPGPTATDEEKKKYEKDLKEYRETLAAYEKYQEYLRTDYLVDPYLTSDDIDKMDKSLLGYYSASSSRSKLFTASGIATYKLELPKEFSVDFLAGAELKMSEGFSMSNAGRDFIIPGSYSLANTNGDYLFLSDRTATHSQKRTYGYYGEIRGDYKGLASLSVTGRWDWSSTINQNPYFYPSVTGGLLFSELFGISNNWFNYGKLRGNYAVVGKDAPAYLYDRFYKQWATFPDRGYSIDPTHSTASSELEPEMSYSWEIGADLRFFDNRTRLDVAYYSTKVENQIVTVRVSPSSGIILQTRNEGDVENHGVEFTLDQDILRKTALKWNATFNFGFNRGKVVSLPEDVAEITNVQYGDIFTSAYLGGSTTALSGKDYLRTSDGQIICDENGYPKIGTDKNKLIGNREPKFMVGLTNSFHYKNVNLSFMFEGRVGGDIANITGRGLISNGQHKMLEKYRGRQVVFDGVVEQADGTYVKNTTPITLDQPTLNNYYYAVSTNFIEDGSYLRLSYITLGYDFDSLLGEKKVVKGLRLSFTANNVFLLTKYTGGDPACNANTDARGTGSAGIDNYPVPSTRSFNISANVTF